MFELNRIEDKHVLRRAEAASPKLTVSETHRPPIILRTELITQKAGKSEQLLASGILPRFEVENDSQTKPGSNGHCGYLRIGEDIVEGFAHELTHHLDHIVGSAALGAAGTVVTEAAGAAAAVFLAPEVVFGGACVLGGVGLGYAANELYKHAGTWTHAADVVIHPDTSNAAEITKSHKDLQGFGASSLNFAAGSLSGIGLAFGIKKFGTIAASGIEATALRGSERISTGKPELSPNSFKNEQNQSSIAVPPENSRTQASGWDDFVVQGNTEVPNTAVPGDVSAYREKYGAWIPDDTVIKPHKEGEIAIFRGGETVDRRTDGKLIYSSPDRSKLLLHVDGTAISQASTGETSRLRWVKQSINDGFIYQPHSSPRDLLQSMRHISFDDGKTSTHWTVQGILEDPEAKSALDLIPQNSTPLGVGEQRVGLLAPDGDVFVVGPVQKRPDCPFVLQAKETFHAGAYQIERLEYANTKDLTGHDLDGFSKLLMENGWWCDDLKLGNIGSISSLNGRILLIDPDGIYKIDVKKNSHS